jgi:hypothetical protein
MSQLLPVMNRTLSKKLTGRFASFLMDHPPGQVSRHLRCVLLDYIHSQLDSGLPLDFDVWLEEFYELFEILDMAGDEIIKQDQN